jgi:L-lactate dehydrogenase (cytochrome)
VRDIVKAAGGKHALFSQLYVDRNRTKSEQFVKKAEAAGIQGFFVTVDTAVVGKREGDDRSKAEQEVVSLSSRTPLLGYGTLLQMAP